MAMELVQAFLLIHDDIIDRDDLRRGGPTIHKIFEQQGKEKFALLRNIEEREHFGVSLAILVGDICASLANMILFDVKLKNRERVLYEVNKVIRDTSFGQVIDVMSGYTDSFSKNATLKVYKTKTANYTINVPLRIGAILAGASEREVERIAEYAEPLGVAFNVQDDLLELFGEKKKYGKPVGSDLKEGKKTLVVLKTLERATRADKAFIKKKLGDKNMSNKDIERIKKIMVETGALEYCTNQARRLIKKASRIIAEQNYQKEGRDFLLGISHYLLDREC